MLFLILFSKFAILIFSRAEYLPASELFPILAVSSLFYGLGILFLHNIYAIGKTRLNRNIMIVVTTVFFALAFPLIIKFSSFGLAVAYSVSVITLFLLSYIYLRKHLKIKLPFKDATKSIISGLIAVSVVYLLSTITEGLLINVVLIILGTIVYLLLLVLLKFYKEEDVKILKIVSEKFPRFKKHLNMIAKIISK